MNFLKGKRTYISLVLVAILGVLVDIQSSCNADAAELGSKVCEIATNAWWGKSIVAISAVAAWFRKLA